MGVALSLHVHMCTCVRPTTFWSDTAAMVQHALENHEHFRAIGNEQIGQSGRRLQWTERDEHDQPTGRTLEDALAMQAWLAGMLLLRDTAGRPKHVNDAYFLMSLAKCKQQFWHADVSPDRSLAWMLTGDTPLCVLRPLSADAKLYVKPKGISRIVNRTQDRTGALAVLHALCAR